MSSRGQAVSLDGRHRRVGERLPGPVFLAAASRTPDWACRANAGTRTAGQAAPSLIHFVRSATCSAESCFFGGIFESCVRVADGLDQQALLRLPGHDRRPAVAADEQAVAVVDAQPAAGLVSAEWQV